MTKVIVAIGLLCILLGAGMSFVINVKPEEGDLLLSDFQQGDEIVVSENPRFKNLQEMRLRDKLYAFIKDENQGKVDLQNSAKICEAKNAKRSFVSKIKI